MSRPTPVTLVVARKGSSIGWLIRQQVSHNRDMAHLQAFLGAAEAAHVVDVVRRGATLSIAVDSSAWATRLQLRREEILAAFDAPGSPSRANALRIRVRIAPIDAPQAPKPKRPRLSDASRRVLLSAAEGMHDPRLRERLLAIARS